MKYAVISCGNKQYKVQEGDVIVVDKLATKSGAGHEFAQVLFFVDGDTRRVGMPTLADITVSGKVLEEMKGPKIRVSKFKAKAKYRRVTGFRAQQTKIQIEKIQAKGRK